MSAAFVSGGQVTSPSGDTLAITDINISGYNEKVNGTFCDDQVTYGGKEYVPCGRINLYDASRGLNESSPNNRAEHTLWDACGNVESTGSVSSWSNSFSGQMENMWTNTGLRKVTASPSTCFGEWTIEYRFTQTFDSGDTLTATATHAFEVYATFSGVAAAGLVQDTPTGGPIGAAEQAGAGGCASPGTQAHATDFPVNTATGNFWHTFDDLAIPGRGPALALSRTYNSMFAGQDGPFGFGWSDTWGMSLSVVASDATVRHGNCSEVRFSWDGSAWTVPPRMQASLVDNGDGTWTYTLRDRSFYDFDATGRLIAKRDLNGYTTTVTYPDASTRVVTDEAGRSLTFTFTNGRITSVSDSSTPPRTMSYVYDTAGDLVEVHDVAGGVWSFTYDSAHRLVTMRSPRFFGDTSTTPAPEVTNHYDAQGRIDWQSDPLGRVTTFDYTTPGTTAVTDPSGDRVDYAYQDGLLLSETHWDGDNSAAWHYRYDPDTTQRTIVIDPNGRRTTNTFHADGNLLTTTDPLSQTTSFTYNTLGQVTSITEARTIAGQPITRTLDYDTAGNLLTESAPLLDTSGNLADTVTTSYHYDDPAHPGDVTRVVDPTGATTTLTYDNYGNLLSTTAPPTPENPTGNTTTHTYDAIRGWPTSTVSPRGNMAGADPAEYTTTFLRDAHGRVTETRNPEWTSTSPTANRTVTGYDADGNVTSVTDGNGNTTTYVYNPAGELVEEHRPDTTIRRTEYTADGLVERQIDATGATTSYVYDRRDNVTRITYPNGDLVGSAYDPAGNQTGHDGATYRYDVLNRLTGIFYNDAATPDVTDIGYDAAGNRITSTDGTGTSTWAWDSLGRLTSATDGAGATIGYTYDLAGRTVTIDYPNAAGTVTRSYDDAGRLTSVTDWANRATTFGYDPDANLISQDNPNGTSTAIQPDRAGRVSSIAHNATSGPIASFSYGRDGNGQVDSTASAGVPADNHTYGYDALNQLTNFDTDSYAYDPADNLTTLTDGTARTFNNANQLSKSGQTAPITFVGAAQTAGDRSLSAQMPAGTQAGDLAIVAVVHTSDKTTDPIPGYTLVGDYFANGVAISDPVVHIYRRTLDGTETTIDVTAKGKFEKTLVASVYRDVNPTNPIGDIATSPRRTLENEVQIDPVDVGVVGERLVTIVGSQYQTGTWATPTGNTERAQIAFGTTDSAIFDREATTTGSPSTVVTHSTYTYPIGITMTLRPTGTAYLYNRGDRTTIVEDTNTTTYTYDKAHRLSDFNGTATYTYNGDGLRTSTTSGSTTKNYTWDTNGPLPVLLSDGTNNYVYGPGGTPIATIDQTGAIHYHHHDQLGSLRATTDANQNITETRTYDPYGKLTASTGTAATPFGYAGEYTDPESGHLYLRARYYDPTTAQFLTRDPLVDVTQSPYGYAANSPLNRTDPTGLCSVAGFRVGFLSNGAGGCKGAEVIEVLNENKSTIAAGASLLAVAAVPGAGWAALGAGAWSAYGNIRDGNHVDAALDVLGVGLSGTSLRFARSAARYEVLADGLVRSRDYLRPMALARVEEQLRRARRLDRLSAGLSGGAFALSGWC